MKKIALFLVLIPLLSYSQVDKKFWIGCTTSFIAGIGDAHLNVLHFSYDKFEKRFPNANPDKWNPSLTWRNKYKNNDPSQGPKFPGSTTTFIFLTDRWHGIQFTRNTMIGLTFYLDLRQCRNEKWYMTALRAAGQIAAFNLGKEITFRFYNYK